MRKHINAPAPELTVVVPVTLMAGRLSRLEEWLREATNYSIQIIIIHDLRDYATSNELASMVVNLPTKNIEVIEGNFGNPGTARNEGIIRAKGNWIAFWDSDDSPSVETVMSEIKATPSSVSVIVGSFRIVSEQTGVGSDWCGTSNLRDVAMNPGVWRMVFRTDSIKNSRFPSLMMAEDQVFLSKINLADRQIRFTTGEFYTYYLGNPKQLTKSKEALKDISKAILEIGDRESEVSRSQLEFDNFLIARQFLTALRKANLEVKLTVSGAVIKTFKKHGLISALYFFVSLFYIISRKAPKR